MACNSITLRGIGLGCKDNMGGIKEVYLIKEEDITEVTLTKEDGDGGRVDAMIGEITYRTVQDGDAPLFKTYKFRKGTSQMTSTMTTDEAAGTLSVQTDLTLQFSKMETTKRLEIMAMCMESMKAIVLDSNGKYWFLGKDFPVTASAATGQTGTNFGDFGGYNVTLTDNSKEFPYELSNEAVTALKSKIKEAPIA